MPVTLEAEFSPGMPLGDCVQLAKLIEEVGFDRLGISDVVLWHDTFVVQALCAQATERVLIGCMVTNPYSRHPAVLAAAVGSLAELSGGRAFLGIGVGSGLEAVGIGYERPVATLREAVSIIRKLLDGDEVDFEGEIYRLSGARLRLPPHHRVPIAIGTRSEGVMALAGELADAALVGARYLSAQLADKYRSWVAQGERRSGRGPGDVEIAPRLTLCVSHDAPAAYRTMRRDTAEFLVTLHPDDLDLEPARFEAISAALGNARGWYFDPEAFHPPELEELVDDELVRQFSICGSPGEVVDQLRRIADMGFGSFSFKLAPVRRPGSTMSDGLRETVTSFAEVLAEVRALA
ncbi:MAG TPA: LLM class flavin-dependent oxidoreductase [Acidimicrobiales bacterium]|nr:LLM class flavin-dependent oxidoreductase [Acidimicrobiales bacterium]